MKNFGKNIGPSLTFSRKTAMCEIFVADLSISYAVVY